MVRVVGLSEINRTDGERTMQIIAAPSEIFLGAGTLLRVKLEGCSTHIRYTVYIIQITDISIILQDVTHTYRRLYERDHRIERN